VGENRGPSSGILIHQSKQKDPQSQQATGREDQSFEEKIKENEEEKGESAEVPAPHEGEVRESWDSLDASSCEDEAARSSTVPAPVGIELKQKNCDEFKNIAVFPCKLSILPQVGLQLIAGTVFP
jgi:hypothetical protein